VREQDAAALLRTNTVEADRDQSLQALRKVMSFPRRTDASKSEEVSPFRSSGQFRWKGRSLEIKCDDPFPQGHEQFEQEILKFKISCQCPHLLKEMTSGQISTILSEHDIIDSVERDRVIFGPITGFLNKSEKRLLLSKGLSRFLSEVIDLKKNEVADVVVSDFQIAPLLDSPAFFEYVFSEKSGLKLLLPHWPKQFLEHKSSVQLRFSKILQSMFLQSSNDKATEFSSYIDGEWKIDHKRSELRRLKQNHIPESILPRTGPKERGLLLGEFVSKIEDSSEFLGELLESRRAFFAHEQRIWSPILTTTSEHLDSPVLRGEVIGHFSKCNNLIGFGEVVVGLKISLDDKRIGFLPKSAFPGMKSSRIIETYHVGTKLKVRVLSEDSDGIELDLAN